MYAMYVGIYMLIVPTVHSYYLRFVEHRFGSL
jgi:hypothetical protein